MSTVHLIGALVFLQSRSLANAVRIRVRRLRQPKYLVGAVVGLGYLYWFFFRHLLGARRGISSPLPDDPEMRGWIEAGAAAVLFCVVAAQWIFTGSRSALQFTEAELSFLLPAPLSRRMLIRYKLLRSQLGTLLSAAFLVLFTGRFARDGLVVIHLLAGWLVLTLLGLHAMAASFTVQRLTERGLATWKFRAGVIGLLLAMAAVVVVWVRAVPELPTPGNDPLGTARDMGGWLERAVNSGPAPWLLLPFRWLVRPWLAQSTGAFLYSLPPVLLLLVLLFWWVERSEVSFEEASLDFARKRADRVAQIRSGKHRGGEPRSKPASAPFVLTPDGFAPVSLMWNHLIFARATPWRGGILAGGVLILVVALRVMKLPEAVPTTTGFVLLITFAVLALLGGTYTSSGLRRDLGMLDVMKGYPLPGRQIVLGELMGPAVVILFFQWLAAFASVALLPRVDAIAGGDSTLLWVGAVGAALVVAPLNFVNALVPAAATLLFPAWARPGRDIQQPGFEAMGQRIVFGIAQLVLVAVSLAPAAGLGLAGYFLLQWFAGPAVGLIAAAVLASAVLSVEAWYGIRLLGTLFDRHDASEEQ